MSSQSKGGARQQASKPGLIATAEAALILGRDRTQITRHYVASGLLKVALVEHRTRFYEEAAVFALAKQERQERAKEKQRYRRLQQKSRSRAKTPKGRPVKPTPEAKVYRPEDRLRRPPVDESAEPRPIRRVVDESAEPRPLRRNVAPTSSPTSSGPSAADAALPPDPNAPPRPRKKVAEDIAWGANCWDPNFEPNPTRSDLKR